MDEVFFIDKDGNKIASDEIESHYGLADLILEKNEDIKAEFEKSKRKDPVDFLIFEKGYAAVSNLGSYYRVIKFSSLNTTEKQSEIIQYFHERGYKIDDLVLYHLKELEER